MIWRHYGACPRWNCTRAMHGERSIAAVSAQALLGPYVCSLRSSASPRLPPSCLSPPSLLRRVVCSQAPLARCGNSGGPHRNLCAHLLQHVTLCCKPVLLRLAIQPSAVHADGCGYATRVPCLNFPGISDGIRGRTDIVNNRLTTNPTSSYLQMIKASSSTLESQQACERQCLATCETSSYFD